MKRKLALLLTMAIFFSSGCGMQKLNPDPDDGEIQVLDGGTDAYENTEDSDETESSAGTENSAGMD